MPDLNDVVRHVILRLVVDQAGLGEELAAARAKLKGLQEAEKSANRDRIKDNEKVTEAIHRQGEALGENAKAHDAAHRAAQGKSTNDSIKATTDQIKEQTKAVKQQTVEEAKAAEIRERSEERAKKSALERQKLAQQIQNDATKFDKDQADRETRYFQDGLDKETAARDKADRLRDDARQANVRKDNESTERVERSQLESGQRIYAAQRTADEKLSDLRRRNAAVAIQDAEKVRREKDKTATQEETNAHRLRRIRETTRDQISTDRASLASTREIAGARTDRAQSLAQGAAARTSDIEDAGVINKAERRARAVRDAETHEARIGQLLARTNTEMEKAASLAERRERAGRRPQGLLASFGAVIANSSVIAGRAVSSAPREAALAGTVSRKIRVDAKGIAEDFPKGTRLVDQFFNTLSRGAKEARGALGDARSSVRSFFGELNRLGGSGGGGGGRFTKLFSDFSDFADSLGGKMLKLGQSFFSFGGLIAAVLIAMGPLAAMLGAVGAAALGLAGNIANLSGVLFALPGILGALVGGFGALAIVMQPLQNVFSAYTAAQKQATTATNAAKTALYDYKIAQIDAQKAELAYDRAQVDQPRSYEKLSEARRQAARDIQDYRLQLQKLKFDEEGSELGVESAQQKLRRALADPTANNLDRRIAKHDVEGALFDKRDQKVAGKRLQEDSSLAFKKGVEGSNEVIDAERGVEDATLNVASSYYTWKKAILEVGKAFKTNIAGGAASQQLQAEIAKLPPMTRKVALAVIDVLKGPYKELRDYLSEKIFGPISKDTKKFADVIDDLTNFLGPVAEEMGTLADAALRLFTNPDWKKFFGEQGVASGEILAKLGNAALDVADGFRAVTEIARPFTRFVTDGILSMAEGFKKFTTSDKGRKEIADFLEVTKRTLRDLAPVVKNFVGGFVGFLSALNNTDGPNNGKSFIDRINGGLLDMSKKFLALGDQASKPNSGFQKWLRNVGPLLKDVVHFVGQVGGFFGKLFSDKSNITEAQNILKTIGKDLLPRISEFFDNLSKSNAISKIVDAFVTIADVLGGLAKNGGVQAVFSFFDTLSKGLSWIGAIGKLLDKIPGLATAFKGIGTALGFLAGAALFTRIVALISKITGITALLNVLRGTRPGATDTRSGGRKAFDWVTGNKPDAKLDGPNGVLPLMRIMEGHLATIVRLLGGHPSSGSGNSGGARPTGSGGGGGGGTRPGGGGGALDEEGSAGRPSFGQRLRNRFRRGGSTRGGSTRSGGLLNAVEVGVGGLPMVESEIAEHIPQRPRITPGSVRQQIDPRSDWSRSAITDYQPITNLPSEPRRERTTIVEPDRPQTTRGNSRYRSDRLRPADAFNDEYDEALVEQRRRDAADERNNRPSAGRTTPTQRRRQNQRAAQSRRERTTFSEPSRIVGTATIGDVLTGGGETASYGNLGQYGTVSEPRRERTTRIAEPEIPQSRGGFFSRVFRRGGEPRVRGGGRGGLFSSIGSVLGSLLPPMGDDSGSIQVGGLSRRGSTTDQYEAGYEAGLRAGEGRGGRQQQQQQQQQLPDLPDRERDDERHPSPRRGEPAQDDGPEPSRRRGVPQEEPDSPTSSRSRVSEPGGSADEEPDAPSRRTTRGGYEAEPVIEDRPRRRRGRGRAVEDEPSSTSRRSRRRGRTARAVEEEPTRRGGVAEEEPARRGRLGRGGARGGARGGISRFFGRAAATELEEGVVSRGSRGVLRGIGGGLLRGAGGLARGLAGGLVGAALSGVAQIGGDMVIDKFVKNKDDRSSLSRGLGAVSTGAGIGATIGSIIPGVGTVIGGAVGGLAGGIYSLAKDKNLRNFVGGKISSGVKAVGGFFGGIGHGISNFFGGGSDSKEDLASGKAGGVGGGIAAALGPVGLLLGKTDIGKSIIQSLNKAASGIGNFFTKTIPDFFHKGVTGIANFFTKTLPGLPKKGIDSIVYQLSFLWGFFTVRLPRAVGHFFTSTLPDAAKAAWGFIVRDLWNPFTDFITKKIPHFFTTTIPHWFVSVAKWKYHHIDKPILDFITKTIPHFFTVTIPAWFKAAPHWFKTHVIDNVTAFFTKTLPNFFTVTLPNAIKGLPDFLYKHLVQPILDFFGGVAGHVGDFLKGTWNWAKGLFSGVDASAAAGAKAGAGTGKMSGGLIEGIYQGIEDRTYTPTTPGEFVVRRGAVQQPYGKEFLRDYNEGRFNPADWYAGLTAVTSPAVMSALPVNAPFHGGTPAVVNNTVNSGLSIGDVTINNPVREKSVTSLRRQIQIAAIRHKG